jgi:tRNA(Met) cytidine acetyltransferase
MAAAQLLKQDAETILVTAPRPAAIETLLQHALDQLPGAQQHGQRLIWQGKLIEFVAADKLLRHQRPSKLLLVDEAAAIPTPMLRGLLQHYPRIAFATTVHGYEGTGRAFTLRFEQELAQQSESYQTIELQQPIRWAEGDPLERFLFHSLMLDVELPPLQHQEAETRFQRQDKTVLINNPHQLRQLYALLHTAHYRTRPYDLRQLLDGPNIEIYTLTRKDELLGTVMLATETIEDTALHPAIIEGRRRPRGHLIPQSLASHGGWREALNFSYGRIIRIAVHPQLQNRGLGSDMLRQLQQQSEGLDFLAASFGATTRLLNFWQGNGFHAVRLGFHRETNSGLYALMVLKPLSEEAEQHCHHWRARLQQQLPLLVSEAFSQLEDDLLQKLLGEPGEDILDEDDQHDVADFIHGYRQYEACILGLQRLLQQHPDLSRLPAESAALIQDKLLRKHSWPQLAQQHGLKGRREAEQRLRKAIETLQNTLQ